VRHLGKGLSGIIVANLSWILGLKMLYNGAKKAIQNPDEVFNDLDKAAGRFFGDV
jgi:hypothetical protein